MNTLREAVHEYLAMRRSLGFKLQSAGPALLDFVSFLARHRAAYITLRLALAWATQPSGGEPDTRAAQRLSFVRLFARYRSATDPRTQIPPAGLLPFRPKRARPYLYSDREIQQLLRATLHRPLSPRHRKRCALLPWVYYCLFGLLSVSGLRLGIPVIPTTDSGTNRPPVPEDSVHGFRIKPSSCSGGFRPAVPEKSTTLAGRPTRMVWFYP